VQIWFVTFYGGLAFIAPYFNLILQRYGYAGWQLGIIAGLRPFISASCSPVWAAMADKFGVHRRIFLCTLIFTIAVRPSGVCNHQ
jgi:nitrate/nitrite transporter NarK